MSQSDIRLVKTAVSAVCLMVAATILQLPRAAGESLPVSPALAPFLKQHCIDCHAGADGEAGLDLEAVLAAGLDPVEPHRDRVWLRSRRHDFKIDVGYPFAKIAQIDGIDVINRDNRMGITER